MTNKMLITTVTHGDEVFSIPVVKRLAREFNFDWQINNPRAYKIGKRYYQQDLNRSGPGDSRSPIYEERLAKKIITKASKYSRVIDIHGSISNCGIFIILSEASTPNLELARKLNISRVVLWPSLRPTRAPLTQFIPNSLEIECGPMQDKSIANKLEVILANFLRGKSPVVKQELYIVTGTLEGNIKKPMRDFVPTTFQGQAFVPLLVDQYPQIKCYMLQKFSDTLAK